MQIVEYADWALRQFFEEARKQPWFDNTIFVLEGDHGKLVGDAECELPESYNHIPLMIYSNRIQPEEKTAFGGQVDIQPTILGLLNIDYLQNNFGVDLLKEERPCMFYTADNMVVGRNDTLLYLYNYETQQELTYDIGNGKLNAVPMDDSFLPLKEYSFSMLQSAEFLVKHGKRLILYLLLNNRSRFGIFRLLLFNELVYLGYLPEYSFRGFIYLLKLIPFFLEFGKIFLCIIRAD